MNAIGRQFESIGFKTIKSIMSRSGICWKAVWFSGNSRSVAFIRGFTS